MAGKVTREKRNSEQAQNFANERRGDGRRGMSTDEFISAYTIPPREVDFPWGLFIIFLAIDGVDIAIVFTGPGALIWSIFTFLIVLPFELWYVKQREEKYSDYKIQGEMDIRSVNYTKKLASKGAQIKRLESKVQELAKAGKTAQAAKLAGNMKRVVPVWLRNLTVFLDKIPYIGMIPGNTLLIVISYYDNKESVRAIQAGIRTMAGNMDFKVTRVAGSNK